MGTASIPSRKLDVTVDDPSNVTAVRRLARHPGAWKITVVAVTSGVSETSTFEVVLQ